MNLFERSRILLTVTALTLATAGSAFAQDNRSHLNDFVHYVMIAKPDLAKAHIQSLFDSGITDAELASLVDDAMDTSRFEGALRRGRSVLELEGIVAQLESRVESGRLDLARDSERIKQAIQMLGGTQRQRMLAERRLLEAGEYAVPELLRVVLTDENVNLRIPAREMIVDIGRQAVSPLNAALSKVDDQSQVIVAEMLGRIGWGHAGPYLLQLAQDGSTPEPVREAAMRAYNQIGGGTGNVSNDFANLSRRYFDNEVSLIAFPTEETNNVWSYDAFVGLVPTPVVTDVYNEVMAMQAAEAALRADASNSRALSLFIASNLKRENELPDGSSDPIYGEGEYSPAFYALAAGPAIIQDVLAIGLNTLDTALIRDAIAALSRTAGGANLWTGSGDRRPLLEALQYPDRRVRYEAALALGKALPTQSFSGDFQVVPLLASAVRAGARTFAVVIADADEDQTTYTAKLEQLGYEVIAFAPSVAAASLQIAQAPGVDVVVVRQSRNNAIQTVEALQLGAKTAVAPVLVLADATDVFDMRQTLSENNRVLVNRVVMADEAFAASLEGVIATASGGRIDESEAQIYAIEALSTLRDIAVNGTTVYEIGDAESALIGALTAGDSSTPTLLVGDVLARIASRDSQQALLDAAFTAEAGQQVALLERVADSAKRFGNLAESRHVDRLMQIIRAGGTSAEAAAQVHGSYNLPPSNVVDLIIGGN